MVKIFTIKQGIDLSELVKYTLWHENTQYFNLKSGVEHYRLLADLSSQCDDGEIIYDIGSYLGFSALALSYNQKIKVTSYDVEDCFHGKSDGKLSARNISNISFVYGDCTDSDEIIKLAKSQLILLDVDPHDGLQEKEIYTALKTAGFKGILICDDINLNAQMKDFWDWVDLKKYDVSKYGHWSGTGIIVFDDTLYDISISDI